MNLHFLSIMQAAPSGGSGLYMLLFQVAAIGLVFYFLILRPQSQSRKKHAELLTGLKKNDEVMTAGGLIGKVREMKEVDVGAVKETRVTIDTGTATVVVERSRIIRIGASTPQGTPG